MNAANYLGYHDWRLPTVTDTSGGLGCFYIANNCGYNVNPATSEMAHLYYNELGNKAYYNTAGAGPQEGWGLSNTGPFSNLQPNYYWSGTEYAPDTHFAWYFHFLYGIQNYSGVSNSMNALAVRTGQVTTVPVPAAAWLLGSGLVAIAGLGRRKR